ncbi:uncharacterized protein [Panulirus ornatus]|uniref:uncharacterized protein isoform X2 n=1 Tax=Panulirus ornatus TaxID=150431 RepID=UPI003A877815
MDWYLLCQEGPSCLIQLGVAVGLLILGWLLLINSGPSLPSQIGKKSSITADTANTRSRGDLDSDSDEDGGLFGSKREPSFTPGSLHSSTHPPSTSKREKSGDLFADINSHTPPAPVKSSVGVENVRAMPNPTRTGLPGTSRPQNNNSNLFASDTDDEGDLFSSKPLSSAKTKSQNSKVKNQPEQSSTAASGLFSSDEDGGLFSTPIVKTQGIVDSGEDHEQKEEPPSLPKSTGKKTVPVGGINIFGSAITSAIHQQHSSESEPSHDEGSTREISRNSSVSLNKPEPPSSQQSATHKITNIGGDGLFDDDEEEDLFGSIIKKPVTSSLETKTGQKEPVLPVTSDTIKKPNGEGTLPRTEVVADTSSIKNVIKSTGGLFSDDDDDDLFGIPAKVEKRPNTLPILPATGGSDSTKKTSETNSAVSNAKHDGQFDSDPIVTTTESQDIQKSDPVKVPDPPKTLSSSLFSSPSDDDDLFSPSSRFPSTKSTSAFMTEPPPLPPPSTSKPSHVISGSPAHQDSFSPSTQSSVSQIINEPSTIDQISNETSVKVKAEQRAKGLPSNNRFSPPSDDDLFSSSSKTIHDDTAIQKTEERIGSISTLPEPTVASENVSPNTTTNVSSQKLEPEPKIPISPDENLFKSKTDIKVDQTKEGANPSTSSKSEMPAEKSDVQTSSDNSGDDIFSDALSRALLSKKIAARSDEKESDLLGVGDDVDIFATTKTEAKSMPYENAKDGKDIVSTSVKQSQHQKDPVPAKVTNSDNLVNISETSVRDRENLPSLPSDAENTKVPQTSQSEFASVSKPEKPPEIIKKPPVGGVALFGGAELAAQVSKRKSMLSPKEAKDEEVREERSTTPHIEKPVLEEENINSISKSNIFDGESDDDDLFGISQVKSERRYSQFSRLSPPPLPTKTKMSPSMHSQEPESSSSHIQEGPKTADTKLLGAEIFSGESELPIDKKSKTKDLNESNGKNKLKSDKTEQIVTVEKESRETKPHKKPPIGGVSMFGGGGGFGGSELLAKVQQRKSMLAPESESDEDDCPTNSLSSSPAKKENTIISARENITPVSPVSPVSPLSPVFGSEPLIPKSGGQEKSVSFDEPTTTSTTLQSLNKSRVRGSQRRRPPSRAHRRGGLGENDPSVLPDNRTDIEYTVPPQAVASSSVKHSSPSPTTASHSKQSVSPKKLRLSEVNEDKTVVVNASSAVANEPNEVDSIDNDPEVDIFDESTITKITNVENNEKSADTSAKEESKFVALKDNSEDVENDLFGNSISALNSSKISGSKGSSKSIFGGNDSDDEELFGQTKPKTSLLPSTGSFAVQNSVTKSVAKPPSAHSLFEDDDDDIFSSASKVEKPSTSVPRKVSASKSKSNLKPSSEPFEDPLLSNLK